MARFLSDPYHPPAALSPYSHRVCTPVPHLNVPSPVARYSYLVFVAPSVAAVWNSSGQTERESRFVTHALRPDTNGGLKISIRDLTFKVKYF